MVNYQSKEKRMSTTPKDYDNDGVISDREIELEIKLEKANGQLKLAVIALAALIIIFLVMMTPYVPIDRIVALSSIADVFFLGLASIVGAYMGFSAWMMKK